MLSMDNKTARIRYACSPCNSMTSAAFSGALCSHAASMPSCPSCSRRALCTLCQPVAHPSPLCAPGPLRTLFRISRDVACICPLPCRAGETLSSMHARQAVEAAVRSSAARGIRQAHRDFGAPPSRHLHRDLGGNDTARLSKVPVVRVAPACSSASTTLASHAFMLVLRAVKERGMWLSGCTTGGEDVGCICPLPCRAGETLSSMHARSTRDMLWLPPCAHAAAQQGAFGERTETSGDRRTSKRRGRRRPRTSTRRGRRPAWRGRRHDFPISCSHAEPSFMRRCRRSLRYVRSAQRQKKTMSPPACRTAIACALICQKRLKRDELMRIHQSDTISVGA